MIPVSCKHCGQEIWSRVRKVCPACRLAKCSKRPRVPKAPEKPKPNDPQEILRAVLQDMRSGPVRGTPTRKRKGKQGYQRDGSLGPVRKGAGW